jgi:hypothetical protein
MNADLSLDNKALVPKVLLFIQPCPIVSDFESTERLEKDASYSDEMQMSMMPDGTPLYCARSKRPPTSCSTPGHMIKAGYTPSGKYKTATYVPPKSDRRAGK